MEELDSDSEARRLITLIRRDLVSWCSFEHRLLSALDPRYSIRRSSSPLVDKFVDFE
jgi:hypothetical protein